MSEYILILVVYFLGGGGGGPTTATFASQSACEAAKVAIQREWERSKAICVPRGAP
jgi:hypothetical protein